MALTLTQKLLIYGLTLFPIPKETRVAIFFSLETEEEKRQLIAYLKKHPEATKQDVLDKVGEIIESTM